MRSIPRTCKRDDVIGREARASAESERSTLRHARGRGDGVQSNGTKRRGGSYSLCARTHPSSKIRSMPIIFTANLGHSEFCTPRTICFAYFTVENAPLPSSCPYTSSWNFKVGSKVGVRVIASIEFTTCAATTLYLSTNASTTPIESTGSSAASAAAAAVSPSPSPSSF